jgi:hypothetical protein
MKRKSLVLIIPLTMLLASSAVSVPRQADRQNQTSAAQKRIAVPRVRLTGNRTFQQVVTWTSGSGRARTTHLAVESAGPNSRTLWQAEERVPVLTISNVRVADLDGDQVPEILGVFWGGPSSGGTLRVFHWDRGARTFVELTSSGERGIAGVESYQLRGRPVYQRIVVYTRAIGGGRRPPGGDTEFEVRGSELVRTGGGGVTPQGESGIEGQAVISPARPGPIRQGDSGSAPYQTTLVVLNNGDGREVARMQTGSDGRFRVSLPPGEYTVGPAPDQPRRRFPRGEQQTVKVLPGQFTKVTIGFDSGMR